MKILVVGKFYTEGFALHISEALSAMGHVVLTHDPGVRSYSLGGRVGYRINQIRSLIYETLDPLPVVRASRIRSLFFLAEQERPDLVFVCHDFLWPKEVVELKKITHAQIVMWFPDAMVNFGRGFFMNAPYDALFFKDPYIVHIMGDVLKSPVFYLPECFSPERHSLPDDAIGDSPDYMCDITTAGNQHSWRVAVCKNLADYNVRLWGNPAPLWMPTGMVSSMHQGRSVYNHEKVRAFRGAKIVLNNLHYSEILGVNARAFEIAGAGAFQMIDWRPGLNQLLADGKEVISFRGMKDLLQKVSYWLPRDQERRQIAEAGRKRAHSEHTYVLRLSLLLDTLKGSRHGYPLPSNSFT